MDSEQKKLSDENESSTNKQFSRSDDYINVLEMNLQLLQREVEYLRSRIKPVPNENIDSENRDSETYLTDSSSKFHSSATSEEVLSILHELLLNKFSIIESNIYFFTESKSLKAVSDAETTLTLGENLKYLEEQGIIDWAIERKTPSVIPNISDNTFKGASFFVIVPLFLRSHPIGVFIARTIRDVLSFSEKELNDISIITEYAAIALDNIRSTEEISRMNKSIGILNKQMFVSARFSSLGELSVAIAHEIINPMKVISANLQLIESGMGDSKRRFEIIKDQINHVGQVLNRVLEFADSSLTEQKQSIINVNEIIEEVLIFTNTQLQHYNIVAEKETEDNSILIKGFKSQIIQVFLNLILKARDFMPDGGKLSIGIYKTKDKKVLINFTDSGVGIEECDLIHIFEPYYTIKNGNISFGMGLYIAKNIIEQHKGQINVLSESGKGTTFKLTFPIFVERNFVNQLFGNDSI